MSSRSEASTTQAARPPEPSLQDWGRLVGDGTLEDFGSAWLALAGARSGALRGVLVVRKPGADRFAPVAFFPQGKPCGTFLADVAERALVQARPVTVEEGGALGVAFPVEQGRRLAAVAAFEYPVSGRPQDALLRELQWGLPWIERRLARESGSTEPAAAQGPFGATVLPRVVEAKRFEDAARAAATELAHAYGFDRVGVALLDAGVTRLVAISHTAHFDPRLALPKAIEAALAEVLRDGKPAMHPSADGTPPSPALGRLAAEGAARILCVPVGSIAFSFKGARTLDPAALPALAVALRPVSAALELVRSREQPLAARVLDATRAHVAGWSGPASRRRWIFAGIALAVLAGLAFGKMEYRVTGEASLEGSVRRVLSAPFDGYVAAANARAGDRVKQGASLAALDDRDLRLERVRVASQRAQYARQIQEASARHERGQMQILQAQLAQSDAQLSLLDEQLGRARLVAPFDGLVVSGDLSQLIGSAVRKGDLLFEVAPLAGYRVVVFVDESEISRIAPGQKGTLLLAAITDTTFPITVTSVTPVARTKEGRNAFRVEASLEDGGARLRPGMEGVAKIETGSRNIVWIWTHRFTDWLRLTVWGLWP